MPSHARHARPLGPARSQRRVRRSWLGAAALFAAAFVAVAGLGMGSPEVEGAPPEAQSTRPAGPGAREAQRPAWTEPSSIPAARGRGDDRFDTRRANTGPPPLFTLSGYQWPLPRGRLTLGFQHTPWGSRLVDGERFHDGIDLATFCGDRIVAAHSGTVLAAGRRFDDHVGWVGDLTKYYERLDRKKAWKTLPIAVVIDDGNGYRSIYAHFERVVVKPGQRVEAGELIGYEGRTGRASGCHLHYGIFSPLETRLIKSHPDLVRKLKLPRWEIARIDPLEVLPHRAEPAPKEKPKPSASAAP